MGKNQILIKTDVKNDRDLKKENRLANLTVVGKQLHHIFTMSVFKKGIRVYLLILFFGFVFWYVAHAADSGKVVSEKTSLYFELMPAVIKWKNALLSRDFKSLAASALPEEQEYIELALKDKKSILYRSLYVGEHSAYNILKKAKKLKIILVERSEEEAVQMGPWIAIYYYDEYKIKPKFPLTIAEQNELVKKGVLFVHGFLKEDGHWYTTYITFEEGDY